MRRSYDAVVIGGGVIGLSAAWHLGRMGHRVAVIERFRVGHLRGSSHGASRVARAAYADPDWVAFAQESIEDGWTLVERASGTTLLAQAPLVLFGPEDGPIRDYAAATEHVDSIETISRERLHSSYPQLEVPEGSFALEDRSGGLIKAAEALETLKRLVREEGGRIFEASTVLRVVPQGESIVLETERGTVECQHCVIAAGPWTPHVLPFLAPTLHVARQYVGYAHVSGPTAEADFPMWAYVGEETHYGLPAVRRQGVKIAKHEPRSRGCDARRFIATAPADVTSELQRIAAEHLHDPVTRLVSTETCLYTSTHNEDFVIDLHPEDRRISIGAGFSGHGFKFAPLVGRILADLASRGKTEVKSFEALRTRFSIGTHLRVAEGS
ncbi:MAG: N-methyl-L-tryptophan oxidase [Proteobacteria bacterium]|nr:N-methyl-L-tryptophan oxidase [Pseudomonadota bacterium]